MDEYIQPKLRRFSGALLAIALLSSVLSLWPQAALGQKSVEPVAKNKAPAVFVPADHAKTKYQGYTGERMALNLEMQLLTLNVDTLLRPFEERSGGQESQRLPSGWRGEQLYPAAGKRNAEMVRLWQVLFAEAGLNKEAHSTPFPDLDPKVSGQAGPGETSKRTAEQMKPDTGTYNVRDFGATGDGKTLDTQAINRTIAACSAKGGGTVHFPPGVYLTGTVHLKSNLSLHLEAGATLLGSKNLMDYEDILDPERKQAGQWHAALIEGHGLRNVAITGRGAIDGNNVFNPDDEENMRGPHAIFLSQCESLSLQDYFVKDASNYAHLLEGCSSGSVRGVTVSGGWDGIDLFDCKDFTITDCHFTTGDDCVAGGGWERVVVANCTLNSSCSGMRNYKGGLKNVIFANLVITGPGLHEHRTHGTKSKDPFLVAHKSWHGDHDTLAGFLFTSAGVVDNVVLSNISVSNLRSPLWMSVQHSGAAMRNISINNLNATMVGKPSVASLIQGSAESPIENLSLSDINIVSAGAGTKDMLAEPVPAKVGDPNGLLPCYGLFCRNIKNLELRNVRLSYAKKDARPALICEEIEKLALDGVTGQAGTEIESPIKLMNIKTLRSRDAEGLPK
jgi:Pectate lyase superfamily protein